ncbi:MAG: tetratricopeptide repeat protein [Methanolinea sp.]|nr:MAG: tetratricopeptide repeat protein [Methanolinea sp.]
MPNEAAVYWKNRGDELAKQELYEEAIRCYENATRISPQYISAWNNFGYSLFKIGRINDANQIKIKIKELKKLESGQEIDIKGSEQKESQKKSRSFNIRVPAVQNKTQIKQDLSEKQIQIHEGIQNLSKTATKTSFKVLGSIGGAVGSIKEAVKAETRRISYNNLPHLSHVAPGFLEIKYLGLYPTFRTWPHDFWK